MVALLVVNARIWLQNIFERNLAKSGDRVGGLETAALPKS